MVSEFYEYNEQELTFQNLFCLASVRGEAMTQTTTFPGCEHRGAARLRAATRRRERRLRHLHLRRTADRHLPHVPHSLWDVR